MSQLLFIGVAADLGVVVRDDNQVETIRDK